MPLRYACACLVAMVCCSSVRGYIEYPGPRFRPTKGEVWPMPQKQTKSDDFRVVIPSELKFEIVSYSCDILENATKRYSQEIDKVTRLRSIRLVSTLSTKDMATIKARHLSNLNNIGRLDSLVVNLTSPCEMLPYLGMNESYVLQVLPDSVAGTALLNSASIWGILRGLETFFQGMYFLDDNTQYMQTNVTFIEDYPRFQHRGVLLDTSRHFISKFTIMQILDGLSYNKFNVFHWHIVDDQSFPYQSVKFPTLSEKGAYHASMVYTPKDVADIIEYARMRGIRVIPEFDTPGHTRSWGEAFPKLLAQCYNQVGRLLPGELGPIDPSQEETYQFMDELLKEVSTVFKDQYIHLGGDEVGFECWENNPGITRFMKENNITDYKKLESVYIKRIVEMLDKLNTKSIVWQEVFENNVKIPNSTVVHIWYGNMPSSLYEVTLGGHKTLLSTCWYLDHLTTGGDWTKFYDCDPHNFFGSEEQKKLVIGGEACMWAEVIDNTNVLSRIFPRASATAEKLWSASNFGSGSYEVKCRLEEHTCRMNLRGIPAQPPSGPGYCIV